jgi:chromosomal replication initiator protein
MDLNQFWEKALGDIELQVSKPNFVTWFKNSRVIDKQDGVVVIGLPNNFAKEWVEKKYDKVILGSLRSLDETIKKVEFIIYSQNKPLTSANLSEKMSSDNEVQLSFTEFKIDPETNLNPQYTLQSYAVGSTNELAYAAVMAILSSVGNKYNPLFIYGGVGVGKTHLIQAAGNEIKRKSKGNIKVRYVSSEKFTNDVIWAMRNKRMDTMKDKYRNVDVLIIDDIQFIGGKAKTEEEFFHTFNALFEQNKQIILSSDRSPKFIPVLEERLSSRFEGGMTVDISSPDFELKVAVLRNKLEERGIELSSEVVNAIASKTQKNLRELEGILNKVLFYQEVKKEEINAKTLDQIIDNIVQKPAKTINPDQIMKAVSNFFEISIADIISRSRKKEIVEPRQVSIYLLRDMLGLSYPYIADKVGKRDHTTAIYAYDKIKRLILKNQILNQKIIMIRDIIDKG